MTFPVKYILGFSVVGSALAVGLTKLGKWTAVKAAERTVVHSGILEKIEYTVSYSTVPMYGAGRLSQATSMNDKTVVHFQDGCQVLIDGKIDCFFPKGTQVEVQANGFGRRSLVRGSV